jgi:type I restriction enzyme, S subunit
MSFPRYPKYKDSGVEWLGEVPEHWDIQRLKRICRVFPSNVDKKSVEGEAAVLLCNYTDVYYNDRIVADMEFMPATATDDQIAKFTLQAGDTIITKDSETADDIAVAAYVPHDLPGVVCGYHLSMVRPREGIDGAFVKRLFDSAYPKSCFAVRANGLTRVGLSQYELDNVDMPVPPSAEQAAIAAFLDRETAKIDALIAEQQRLIELLQEKRQAVISYAVTKGLNPDAPMKDSGIEWLGEVPEHWDVRKFRTLANVVRGSSPRPAGDPTLFDGDFMPWVTVAEITKDESKWLLETSAFLTELGATNSRFFEPHTLLYSNSGATLGVPKILGIRACANDGVIGFLDLSDDADISFLYFFLYSITEAIREKVKQGSGQPNLNTDIVKDLTVALPPKSEQLAVTGFVEDICAKFDALSSDASRAIALLQERRSALISAAVTGQIDVRGLAGSEAA